MPFYHKEMERVKNVGSEHLQGANNYCYVDEMHNIGIVIFLLCN